MSQNNLAIILSGGLGKRFDKKLPKQFYKLNNKHILEISVEKFIKSNLFKKIIVVTSSEFMDLTKEILKKKSVQIVIGGKTRQKSVLNGLIEGKKYKIDNVLIHDAARPLVTVSLIANIVNEIQKYDCVIPMIKVNDSLRRFEKNIYENIKRENVNIIQTPQAFKFNRILNAHLKFKNKNFTDDSIISSKDGIKINPIEGEFINFKITSKDDLEVANMIEGKRSNQVIRVGSGFDVHEFEKGDAIKLFGITIPFNKKLKGHSDADVGLHALTDAILGAIGKGDIGEHFPPSNSKWKNQNSEIFLLYSKKLMEKDGYKINNLDLTLMCEKPKVTKYKTQFKEKVSFLLNIKSQDVNVKATTTEKLGFLGREEGIACHAIVTVSKNE
jgi:2-C-methyl-D-erythritol 4-phosphate cytidylyltransferase/2-C-methyl-D-erythritol 2,4-cyclodiphosphate synthase